MTVKLRSRERRADSSDRRRGYARRDVLNGARWCGVLAALGLATVAATGCGAASTLDPTRIEKAIEVSIVQQRHALSIAVCPTGVARRAGMQFTCTATTANGRRFRFLVTEKDNRGNVHYEAAGTLP